MDKPNFWIKNRERIIWVKEKSDLIDEIVNYTINNLISEDCMVIFPNRRAIHYFYSKISKRLKKAFKVPLAYSIDDFIDYIYEKKFSAFRKINILESIDVIYLLLNNTERFDSFRKIHNSFEEFIPWGEEFFKNFEELLINNVSFNSFDKINIFSNSNLYKNSLIYKVLETDFVYIIKDFFDLYKDFYSELKNRKLSTRASRYNSVQRVDLPEKTYIIGGFSYLNKCEEELFRNILSSRKSHFFVKRSFNFYDLENKKFYIYQSQTLNGQVIKLKDILEQKKPLSYNDVIVLTSENSLFPVLYNAIPKGEKYNISVGYPLSRTPIYSLFDMISVLLSRMNNLKFYAKDYVNLLFHPYIKTLKFDKFPITSENFPNIENFVARIIFQKIQENIKYKNKIFVSLFEFEKNLEIFKGVLDVIKSFEIEIHSEDDFISSLSEFLVEIHDKVIKLFLNIKNFPDFIEKAIDLLDYISIKSLGHLNLYGNNFFRYTYETLFDLYSTKISHAKFKNFNQYFDLLKFFMQNSRIPFSSSILEGIQILGALETRNINFNRVFYMDISDDKLPNVNKEELFLTQDIRKILDLPTVKESEEVQRANFVDLINTAKEVYFFYSNSDARSISRFVENIIWELQKIRKSVEMPIDSKGINFQASFAQENPVFIEKNDNIIRFLKNFEFSPTSIDSYLRCPLSFYFAYVLNLKEYKEIEEDISSVEIGNIVHDVLHLYFKKWLNVEFTNVDFENELKEIYKILDKKFQENDSKGVLLQKEQCRLALRNVLEKNIKELTNMKILFLEKEFTREVSHNKLKVKLIGRVDRIHKLKDEYFLIDYKTGASKIPKSNFLPTIENRKLWFENVRSFQLPFYIFLFEKFQKINFEQIIAGTWSLKSIDEEKYFKFNDETYDAYFKALKYLISEIFNKDIPFFPVSNKIEQRCAFCLYQSICSRQWVKNRKFY
ncbi:PD-(D/E)XK nuclease superfamily protein [Thermodesulfobium acidiphilum]|uniref:PD-(D/E)XK nuclease superfamily protein n=1 Tax=Thermodesulfobium acidiphilum TaxID=1794699 RepID=A0A2R4W064_THEAF|nr:PD-(D/E)XK nuclease family protein [Thermodesulfobium acidiphilum]AWB10193.1 PD-(D/E)XK nuclease superfamily protein [Thermodesulfobium acidiphilum]